MAGRTRFELVQHIRARGLANNLFAFTSHADLVIGLYPELDRRQETLHVSFDMEAQAYDLRYFAQKTGTAEVSRTYPKDTGIKKFTDLIE